MNKTATSKNIHEGNYIQNIVSANQAYWTQRKEQLEKRLKTFTDEAANINKELMEANHQLALHEKTGEFVSKMIPGVKIKEVKAEEAVPVAAEVAVEEIKK